MPHDDVVREQAAGWAVRVGDPAFEDWDGFTHWLSESPAHAEAYDRVAAAVADAVEVERAEPVPANDAPMQPARHTRRWFGGAIAASLVAVLAVGFWHARDQRYTVETAAGQVRTVALADGGSVDLAGGTRLVLDRGDARFASLEEGQALFSIRHDAAHPFSLKLGDDTVVDAGTVFDVRRDSAGMGVAVSEGSVVFNPESQKVHLGSGEMIARGEHSDRYVVSRVPVEQVGEWREGRITFRQASLVEIADRLSRASGIAYSAGGGRSVRAYSGSVLVAPLRSEPQSLGPLLGVKVTPAGKGWGIEAP
jgi:transmembrane sensor